MAENEMYKLLCEKQFEELKESGETAASDRRRIEDKVDLLNIQVNNGLDHRVKRIEGILWGAIVLTIVQELIGRFF